MYSKCVSVISHEITNYILSGKIFAYEFVAETTGV